jgi:predicted RNase H-like nuclease
MKRPATLIAGVDGCPGGWLAVIRSLDDPASAHTELFTTFQDLLDHKPALAMIAIDIPIGLPERAILGGRTADVAARTVLGARQSAVFSVPARAAIMEPDYRTACDVAFANSNPPRKISKQMFNIFLKIRQVDALLTPAVQARVREVHPEVAFAALNGWIPLDQPKKMKSQPNPTGLALRRDLLISAGYSPSLLATPFKRKIASPDDLLDACVNSWTAARILNGTARCFPTHPPIDSKGLRCEIWG